jgi:RNA-directed DNA polymerase
MNSRTTNRGHTEKSDTVIVPMRSTNKSGKAGAESREGRDVTKRNTHANVGGRTQGRVNATCRLMGVREAARRDKRTKFTALFHHVTIQLLRESFYQLKRLSVPGVDGQSWKTYEQKLEENLRELHENLHCGSYRPKPARRITIPKADGSERPISVQSVRDKVAQMAVVKILERIYEEQFLGFSYGFRPGRNQHDALDALTVGLKSKKVNWVLDLDIRKYLDHTS